VDFEALLTRLGHDSSLTGSSFFIRRIPGLRAAPCRVPVWMASTTVLATTAARAVELAAGGRARLFSLLAGLC